MLDRLRHRARSVKRDALAVYLAARDARVPWYAKGLALCVAAYFSPIALTCWTCHLFPIADGA